VAWGGGGAGGWGRGGDKCDEKLKYKARKHYEGKPQYVDDVGGVATFCTRVLLSSSIVLCAVAVITEVR
jgi:hypothetical protein